MNRELLQFTIHSTVNTHSKLIHRSRWKFLQTRRSIW